MKLVTRNIDKPIYVKILHVTYYGISIQLKK